MPLDTVHELNVGGVADAVSTPQQNTYNALDVVPVKENEWVDALPEAIWTGVITPKFWSLNKCFLIKQSPTVHLSLK